MNKLLSIAQKAKHSKFYLWLLNLILWRVIPFNHSHSIWIMALTDTGVTVKLPYIRSNQNHLKGMHACALATLCEYACGISLITRLDPKAIRLILKDLKMDYHSQGKGAVFVTFNLDERTFTDEVLNPLTQDGAVLKTFVTEVFDLNQKLICTGQVTWQLKQWDKVRN